MSRSPAQLLVGGLLSVLLFLAPGAVQAQEPAPPSVPSVDEAAPPAPDGTPAVPGGSAAGGEAPITDPEGLARMTKEVEDAADALREINEKLVLLDLKRQEIDANIANVKRDQLITTAEATRRRRAIERLDKRINRNQKRVEALRELLTSRAIAAFVSGTPTGTETVLDPDLADDSDDIHVYLSALNDSDDELAERIDTEAARLRKDRRRQRAQRSELGEKLVGLERLDVELVSAMDELAGVIEETEKQAEEAQEKVEQALSLAALISAPGVSITLDGRATCTAAGFIVACDIAFDVASMVAAAEADGVVLTGSGWRDTGRQIQLRAANCDGDVYGRPASACRPPTARPGSSQHERGRAIDFANCSSRSTECFKWLAENAAEFGFKNLPSEPWHWSTTGT